jgi:hypothetical protein
VIEDILGEKVSWAAALVTIVIVAVWGFNVHEDRQNAHEIKQQIVEECAHEETKDAAERCGDRIREAL